MADIPFQLSDYTAHIKKIADAGNLSVETATQRFIANLTTMKEHYPGASELNYHQLGQQWNKLRSPEKVAQKADVLARMQRYAKDRRA